MGLVVPESHLVVWPPGERTLELAKETDLVRGRSLEPLAPWVSTLAILDGSFHWLMSLAECLRAGRARERSWALQQLGLLWGNAA